MAPMAINPLLFLLISTLLMYKSHGNLEELEEEVSSLLVLAKDRFHQKESSLRGKDGAITVIDVDDYGAIGGGADDTLAFEQAWEAACSSAAPASVLVPKGSTYILKPVTFSGPCKSNVSVMIEGSIEASPDTSDWKGKNPRLWVLFSRLENLIVGGGGSVNGNGQVWWQKSCKIDKSQPCKDAPTALTFRSCSDLTVENLSVRDIQQIHIKFENCNNVMVSALSIEAPEKSPNTDGIHVSETKNIQITNSVIGTGDDCISIVNGSQGVKATNILCGPGHGISIGSLGEKNSVAQVSEVTVDTAKFHGTTNGVRIKTWQGGKGYAKNIIFENIDMNDVKNPIIIDQNYCDRKKKCKQEKSAVEISNVRYKNIKGTSSSTIAIKLSCSKSIPCRGIVLEDVNLVLEDGDDDDDAESFCQNVKWMEKGTVIPSPCSLISDVDDDGHGDDDDDDGHGDVVVDDDDHGDDDVLSYFI